MAYAVVVAGPAGPDKERMVEALALGLEGEGLCVALVESRPEDNAAPPRGRVVQTSQGVTAQAPGGGLSLEELMGRYAAGADVALCLGFDRERRAKVEWVPPGGRPALSGDPGLRAVVGEGVDEAKVAVFPPGQEKALARHLAAEVVPAKTVQKLRVLLGGKRLPAKDFVQDILANTIRAMVASLKGGDRPGRLEVYIEPDQD